MIPRAMNFRLVLPASVALLLPAAAYAQDSGSSQPTPTPGVRVIPEDFRLQPNDDQPRIRRNEPMVQPLPTASPTARPTPQATVQPAPRQTAAPQTQAQPTPAPTATASASRRTTEIDRAPGRPDATATSDAATTTVDSEPVDAIETPAVIAPQSSPVPQLDAPVANPAVEAETAGWGFLLWLVPLLLLAGAALAAIIRFRRKVPVEDVSEEPIAPYRPARQAEPSPPAAQQPVPQPAPVVPSRPQPSRGVNADGFVQIRRPGATPAIPPNATPPPARANPGGLVTTNLAAKRRAEAERSRQAEEAARRDQARRQVPSTPAPATPAAQRFGGYAFNSQAFRGKPPRKPT